MIKNRRAIKIVFVVIIILTILQMTRMGFIIEWSKLNNESTYEYSLEDTKKLSKELKAKLNQHRVLIIPSSDENDLDNYKELMDYIKVNVDIVDNLDDTLYDLDSYDLIICLEQAWSQVALFDDVIEYVENGGKLLLSYGRDSFYDKYYGFYSSKLGIVETGREYEVRAFDFYKELIPGLKKVEAKSDNESLWSFATEVQLMDKAEVLLVDQKNTPLLWLKELGSGSIAVNNTRVYDNELNKALTLSLMEELMDDFVYPIINTKVIFIDDFPGKFVGNNEKVEKEYGRNIERFLAEIWWPDMVSTINEYNTVYTSAFISGYNNNVDGDFELEELISEKNLIRYGREIFKYGGEISFHGYNHQSLVFDQDIADSYGYRSWEDIKTVKEALNVAKEKFVQSYPNYQWRTYVPPSNLFDYKAEEALLDTIPSLKVYSGVLYSDVPGVMVQKFSVYDNGIIQLPRVSSGTIIDELDMVSILSVAKTNGVVNHFIHPDDFMDDDRSGGKTWEEMFKLYTAFLDRLDKSYPWMESNKAYDASQKVEQYHYMDIYMEFGEDQILIACDNFEIDQSLILKTKKEIKEIKGAKIEKLSDDKYLVTMHNNIVVLEVE